MFRGIKVSFFSIASFIEPEKRVATAMRLVCLPRRGLGRAAACSDIYTGWRKQRRCNIETQAYTPCSERGGEKGKPLKIGEKRMDQTTTPGKSDS